MIKGELALANPILKGILVWLRVWIHKSNSTKHFHQMHSLIQMTSHSLLSLPGFIISQYEAISDLTCNLAFRFNDLYPKSPIVDVPYLKQWVVQRHWSSPWWGRGISWVRYPDHVVRNWPEVADVWSERVITCVLKDKETKMNVTLLTMPLQCIVDSF